jgi:hypothetical protein
MEDREVLGRMGEPVDEDREWLRWLGLKPGPGLFRVGLGRSLA